MFSVESPSRLRKAETSSIPFRIARGCDGCIASRRPETLETKSNRSVKHIENAENKPDKRLSCSDSRYFYLTPVSWMLQSTGQLGCSAGSLWTFGSDDPVRGIHANRKRARVRANGSCGEVESRRLLTKRWRLETI